jgi:hypothetical protein
MGVLLASDMDRQLPAGKFFSKVQAKTAGMPSGAAIAANKNAAVSRRRR